MGEPVSLTIEVEREEDERWIAAVPALPGVVAYGQTHDEAVTSVKALALRVAADRLERGEPLPDAVLALFAPTEADARRDLLLSIPFDPEALDESAFVEVRWVDGVGFTQPVDAMDLGAEEEIHHLETGEASPELHALIAADEAQRS